MGTTKGTRLFRGKEVPALLINNEAYMEVATKVALAHEDGGFSEISHEFLTVGSKDVIRICIEFKGKHFYGSAQIKWGGKNADATDPVENAETSARGRALAAAGYHLGAMSSAEDMQRFTRVVEDHPPLSPQRMILWEMAQKIGYDFPKFQSLLEAYTFDGKTQLRDVKYELERAGASLLAPVAP